MELIMNVNNNQSLYSPYQEYYSQLNQQEAEKNQGKRTYDSYENDPLAGIVTDDDEMDEDSAYNPQEQLIKTQKTEIMKNETLETSSLHSDAALGDMISFESTFFCNLMGPTN
jgi:hypothetical protein